MSENEIKYFDVSKGIPSDKLDTVKVTKESVLVECGVFYRGKTNSYVKERQYIKMIVDRHGRVIDGIWNKKWSEVAPGIETREVGEGTRSGKCENWTMESIRIHRSALPVHIHFIKTYEYVDYGGLCNSSHRSDYWERFES